MKGTILLRGGQVYDTSRPAMIEACPFDIAQRETLCYLGVLFGSSLCVRVLQLLTIPTVREKMQPGRRDELF